MNEIKTDKPAREEKIVRKSMIRDAINTRIRQLGLTNYQFAHSGKVQAAPSTVYRFLNGDVESSSGNLDEMLEALGLRIVTTGKPLWARQAKQARIAREASSSTPAS
jgi:hypothetical protein